jgi:hypothetical protein
MSYFRNRSMSGLGGAESCGPNQIWSPDYVYSGIKGQCLSVEQYKAWEAKKAAAATGTTKSEPSWADKLLTAATSVVSAKLTPAPVTQITTTGGGGMSTTTKLAIGGAAALGLLLVLRSRRK